jgi:hypothetical protein
MPAATVCHSRLTRQHRKMANKDGLRAGSTGWMACRDQREGLATVVRASQLYDNHPVTLLVHGTWYGFGVRAASRLVEPTQSCIFWYPRSHKTVVGHQVPGRRE